MVYRYHNSIFDIFKYDLPNEKIGGDCDKASRRDGVRYAEMEMNEANWRQQDGAIGKSWSLTTTTDNSAVLVGCSCITSSGL